MGHAPDTPRTAWLAQRGLSELAAAHWQLPSEALVAAALQQGEGRLSAEGALVCHTGAFTGRSPRDKFIVQDETTQDTVWWGPINHALSPAHFQLLYQHLTQHLRGQEVYIRDAYAGTAPRYRLPLRIITTQAWHNLFCHNLFVRPTAAELVDFLPSFTIINVPSLMADPPLHGTRQGNFTVINFKERILLIGGTGYAGEMKKGIFTVMNYLLPTEHAVLPMHCAANRGAQDDTAIFFGLSGTGKTTLSADVSRQLIGDDEHGWHEQGVFNFEGGCYAKTINLSAEDEPQIVAAIRPGAILENVVFRPGTNEVDYTDGSVTENTRTAYPMHHIASAAVPSVGSTPKNIFLLTCDAHGVLPPLAKLSTGQAMYHFLAGYTAKVAGTEVGISAPQASFSACFGQAFLPLHPTRYASMLGERLAKHDANIWLVNTGWVGGAYGTGARIALRHTRVIITAVLSGALEQADYRPHPIFGVAIPTHCPGLPEALLQPHNTWTDAGAYEQAAYALARRFQENFEQYADFATPEIWAGGPLLLGDRDSRPVSL